MLNIGKLDSDLLKSLIFNQIKYKSDDVKVRPGIGEDCAVIGFGDWDCVMSTDPITSAVSDIGRLAIHITCNDIASNGVQPLGIMLAVMLPVGTTEKDVATIMEQAASTAAEVGVEIIGGHTEITPAVNQPVIVSTAIGKSPADNSQSGNDMVAGDSVLITKAVGLEGSGIIACDFEEELAGVLTAEELSNTKDFLDQVSVVKEGVAAGNIGTHGMHDITEGGVFGAIWEMCQIADLGAEINADLIPIEPETVKVCDHFGINPN
ncbi:MAG: AIR synthase family protein, partial [Eubacterium sp.]|nr:AIR synthase family protein [Candidatus Colimonas fimequi]